VPLTDGTRIELNTDTRVRTAIGKQRREVWLDQGEAYFDVAHDASRPFVIHAGDRRVTVLGTKFSIRRDGDQVHVAVVEGRVRIEPAKADLRTAPLVARHGDIVVAQGVSTLVSPPSDEKVASDLSWRRGMLTFDQVTLADAAAEFNRYNRTKLVIGDRATAQTVIGGTFDAENIEAFGRLLKGAYGLQVERREGEIEISGGS
jgi:transmembrane sensor